MIQWKLKNKYHKRDILEDTEIGRNRKLERTYLRPLPVTWIPEIIDIMWNFNTPKYINKENNAAAWADEKAKFRTATLRPFVNPLKPKTTIDNPAENAAGRQDHGHGPNRKNKGQPAQAKGEIRENKSPQATHTPQKQNSNKSEPKKTPKQQKTSKKQNTSQNNQAPSSRAET